LIFSLLLDIYNTSNEPLFLTIPRGPSFLFYLQSTPNVCPIGVMITRSQPMSGVTFHLYIYFPAVLPTQQMSPRVMPYRIFLPSRICPKSLLTGRSCSLRLAPAVFFLILSSYGTFGLTPKRGCPNTPVVCPLNLFPALT